METGNLNHRWKSLRRVPSPWTGADLHLPEAKMLEHLLDHFFIFDVKSVNDYRLSLRESPWLVSL